MSNKQQQLASETLKRAVEHHQKGDLLKAKSLYQKHLKKQTNDAESHHLFGLLCLQQGRIEKSIKHQKRAQSINPQEYRYLSYLSDLLLDTGDLKSLTLLSEQPAVRQIADTKFWLKLSKLQVLQKQYQAAVDTYKQLLIQNGAEWEVWLDFGNCYFQMGDLDDALECYRHVVEFVPSQVDALNNIGAIYLENKNFVDAKSYFSKVVKISPNHAVAWYNLATISLKLNQWVDGLALVQNAHKYKPNYSAARLLEAKLHRRMGDFEVARTIYDELLQNNSDVIGLFNDVGNMYFELKQFETAKVYFYQALTRDPDSADAQFNYGICLLQLREFDSARSILDSVLTKRPDYFQAVAPLLHSNRQCCLWKYTQIYSARLRDIIASGNAVEIAPFSIITLEDSDYKEQLAIAKYWIKLKRQEQLPLLANDIKTQHSKPTVGQSISENSTTGKVKIGYLSADFHEHATSYLLARVLELHDKSKFEIVAFSYGTDDGKEMRQRLIEAVDHFVDLQKCTNSQMIQVIQSYNLDILIDLKGFTQNTRSEILLNRLAKYHVNFLGYPATMGRELVDYIIVDDYIVNYEEEQFDEKILKLPNSYQPTDNTRVLSRPPSKLELSLPEEMFVFAAFHQSYKITEGILKCWCNILAANQNSVLWCLINNDTARRQVSEFCEQNGISKERIVFAEKVSQSEHLTRIQQADLILDTYPVNGHTSTSDALWANVPVITCSGNTFISRVAGSLLSAMNLQELICDDLVEYEQLALKLSLNKNSYQALIRKLESSKQSAPLFNTEQYTLDLEYIYERLAEK